jgi:hypothetical protein
MEFCRRTTPAEREHEEQLTADSEEQGGGGRDEQQLQNSVQQAAAAISSWLGGALASTGDEVPARWKAASPCLSPRSWGLWPPPSYRPGLEDCGLPLPVAQVLRMAASLLPVAQVLRIAASTPACRPGLEDCGLPLPVAQVLRIAASPCLSPRSWGLRPPPACRPSIHKLATCRPGSQGCPIEPKSL